MADTTEQLILEVSVTGADVLDALAGKTDKVTNATDRQRDAQGRLVAAGDAAAATNRKAAAAAEAAADATKDLAGATEKGGSKVAGFGQTMLQSGRFVQDFAQGGLGGVLNNIEGLTQALGLGNGLAGILTIVGVGFMLLKPHIEEFWKALNSGSTKDVLSTFETLTKRIKELKDNPVKMAWDTRELDEAEKQLERLKKGRAEFEAQQAKQTPEEHESGKLVDQAIGEAGAPR